MIAPVLLLAVGNPSRGDDALGPAFLERAEAALSGAIARGEVELMTDFQLQIEHALDLQGRTRVVFVDASVDAAPPFQYARVVPHREASFSTHTMSPGAVLQIHRDLSPSAPIDAWVLAIRGERFELGAPLSAAAEAHLDAALSFFLAQESAGTLRRWAPCGA